MGSPLSLGEGGIMTVWCVCVCVCVCVHVWMVWLLPQPPYKGGGSFPASIRAVFSFLIVSHPPALYSTTLQPPCCACGFLVCVCVCESERERVCVCVCVCVRERVGGWVGGCVCVYVPWMEYGYGGWSSDNNFTPHKTNSWLTNIRISSLQPCWIMHHKGINLVFNAQSAITF